MNIVKLISKEVKNPFVIAFIIILFSISIIIFASYRLYHHTVSILTTNLQERILSISITTASNIYPNDISALHTQEDWRKPEWARVVNVLNRSKYSNKDVAYMYIFRKTLDDPTKMEFIADADSINPYINIDVNRDGIIEPNGPDKLQWPGQMYPEANSIPETFEAYEGYLVTSDLYTDQYGTVITGYAPIKDEEGKTIAVLATDINAGNFFNATSIAFKPFIIFLVFLTFIISILILIVSYVWKNYSGSLEKINAERAEFVSIASHHIATPLTVIKCYLSVINKEKAEPEILTIIQNSTEKLIKITQDFVEAYRIDDEKTKYIFNDTNINFLIKGICLRFKYTYNNKNIIFKYRFLDDVVNLSLDIKKFTIVINTILNNSLKYVIEGDIQLYLETDNKNLIIKILDTGLRSLPDVSESLLLKFSGSKNQYEAGIMSKDLALYTSKKIIEAHRGNFVIKLTEPETDIGFKTTFLITLPLK